MEKDIVTKLDEILNFFMKPSMAGGGGQFAGLESELSMLLSKVSEVMRNEKKKAKEAINIVIKNERLNKNWAKKLKQYAKKYI
jgi:hypothetical protein